MVLIMGMGDAALLMVVAMEAVIAAVMVIVIISSSGRSSGRDFLAGTIPASVRPYIFSC